MEWKYSTVIVTITFMVRIKSEKNVYSSSSRKTTVGSLSIQFLSYLGVLLFVFWMFLSIVLKFNGKTLQCVLTWWYLVSLCSSFSFVFVSFDVIVNRYRQLGSLFVLWPCFDFITSNSTHRVRQQKNHQHT